ncbi:MAG: aminotransferase class I/II-fold pyridoxal phosphate-dependent enzyme, partial [Lysinibacillus sp.]
MNCTWPKHGGKTSVIAAVLERKGLQTATAIDFSANINPIGIPTVMIEAMQKAIAENSMTYPDLTYQEHREKIACYEGVPKECVLLTNGGAEAIHLSAAWLRGKKVAIFQPSFSEYEQACQANGVDYDCLLYKEYFHSCSLPDNIEDIIRKYEAVYVCRPNNPSGTCLSFEELNRVVHVAKKYQTYILVDEAFIHFTADEQSAVSLCA